MRRPEEFDGSESIMSAQEDEEAKMQKKDAVHE